MAGNDTFRKKAQYRKTFNITQPTQSYDILLKWKGFESLVWSGFVISKKSFGI